MNKAVIILLSIIAATLIVFTFLFSAAFFAPPKPLPEIDFEAEDRQLQKELEEIRAKGREEQKLREQSFEAGMKTIIKMCPKN